MSEKSCPRKNCESLSSLRMRLLWPAELSVERLPKSDREELFPVTPFDPPKYRSFSQDFLEPLKISWVPGIQRLPTSRLEEESIMALVNNYHTSDSHLIHSMRGRPGIWARISKLGDAKKNSLKRLFLLDTGATIGRIPEAWNKDFLHADVDGVVRIKNRTDGDRVLVRLQICPTNPRNPNPVNGLRPDEICCVEATMSVTLNTSGWSMMEDIQLRKAIKEVNMSSKNKERFNMVAELVKDRDSEECRERLRGMKHDIQHGILGVDFIRAVGWSSILFGHERDESPDK